MTTRIKRLAIMGAGPKAAAIVAKASVVNDLASRDANPIQFQIDVFDPHGIGAHWSGGKAGYTDGEQPLCTPIERDLGFPYLSELGNRIASPSTSGAMTPEEFMAAPSTTASDEDGSGALVSPIDVRLANRFSWQTFKRSTLTLHTWVNNGRKPPSHVEFAEYLKWAFDQAKNKPIRARIVGLHQLPDNRWNVEAQRNKSKKTLTLDPYDGVVITGPGPGSRRFSSEHTRRRVFSGDDFWTRREQVRALLRKEKGAPIAVLGGGGTGAAILAAIARDGFTDSPVTLVGTHATVYARIDNSFENRLFTDNELWQRLSLDNKRAFFDRINRGVVWTNVIHEVERFEKFDLLDGRAESVQLAPQRKGVKTGGRQLEIVVKGRAAPIAASVVIDATGFDPWAFLSLISPPQSRPSERDAKSLKKRMAPDLSWPYRVLGLPPIHVPGLSEIHGPGLGSLMSLGAMSDRILGAYLPP